MPSFGQQTEESSDWIDVDQLFDFYYGDDWYIGLNYSMGFPDLKPKSYLLGPQFGWIPSKIGNMPIKNVGLEVALTSFGGFRSEVWSLNEVNKEKFLPKGLINGGQLSLFWWRPFGGFFLGELKTGLSLSNQKISGFNVTDKDQLGWLMGGIFSVGVSVNLINELYVGVRPEFTIYPVENYRMMHLSFSLKKIFSYEQEKK